MDGSERGGKPGSGRDIRPYRKFRGARMDVLPGQVTEVEELSEQLPAASTRYGASDPNSSSLCKGFELVKMPRGKQDFLEETGGLHRSASTHPGYIGAVFQALTSSGFTNLGDFQPGLKDQAAQEQTSEQPNAHS